MLFCEPYWTGPDRDSDRRFFSISEPESLPRALSDRITDFPSEEVLEEDPDVEPDPPPDLGRSSVLGGLESPLDPPELPPDELPELPPPFLPRRPPWAIDESGKATRARANANAENRFMIRNSPFASLTSESQASLRGRWAFLPGRHPGCTQNRKGGLAGFHIQLQVRQARTATRATTKLSLDLFERRASRLFELSKRGPVANTHPYGFVKIQPSIQREVRPKRYHLR